jgi:hypothetical protein
MSRARGAAALIALACLGGCAAPGGGAGTHNDVSRCATVVDIARRAVPGGGTPTTIHPISLEQIDTLMQDVGVRPLIAATPLPKVPGPKPPPPTNSQGAPIPRWCLVVIPGRFTPGSVPGAVPPDSAGDHVLVVATTRPAQIAHLLMSTGVPDVAEPRPWWKFW